MEVGSLTDRLRSQLVKTNAFNVVERGKMDAILKEVGFQQSGCTTAECAVEIGKILNVQQMVMGTIGKVGALFTVDIILVDVASSRIIKSLTHNYEGKTEGLVDLMATLGNELAVGVVSIDPAPVVEKKEVSLRNPAAIIISEPSQKRPLGLYGFRTHLGYSFFSGTYPKNTDRNSGFNVGLGTDIGDFLPRIPLYLEVQYSKGHPFTGLNKPFLSNIVLGLNMQYPVAKYYLGGGLGVSWIKYEYEISDPYLFYYDYHKGTTSKSVIYLIAGKEIMLEQKMKLFVESRFSLVNGFNQYMVISGLHFDVK